MFYALLTILCIILTVKWLKWKVATHSVLYYMELKKITPPSDTEMKACSYEAIQKMFKR